MNDKFLTADAERALVLLAQAGDREALGKLIGGIERLLWQKARKVAGRFPPADPADLVQEAIVRIVRSIGSFDVSRGVRFNSYFGRTQTEMERLAGENGVIPGAGLSQHNRKPATIALIKRHAGPLVALDVPDSETGISLAEMIADHREEDEWDRREIAQVVRQCVERLPAHYQEMVRLRFYEEMTLEEIAALLGCARQAAQQMSTRALRALKAELLRQPLFSHHRASAA